MLKKYFYLESHHVKCNTFYRSFKYCAVVIKCSFGVDIIPTNILSHMLKNPKLTKY